MHSSIAGKTKVRHTLVTVTFNSADKLLSHWSNATFPSNVEWIVIDNASTDGSVSVAKELGANVIPLTTNLGFGAANNVGLKEAAGSFIWFVNPDVSIVQEDLDELAEIAQTRNALVAPQLLNADGSPQPNGRGTPYLTHKILNRIAKHVIEDQYHVLAAPNEIRSCDWLTGAVVGGEAGLLKKLGPWDENFFVYYEDSDLGLRARKKGHQNLVVGSCTWVHSWARDTATFRIKPWKLEISSMYKFYSRYPSLLLGSGFNKIWRRFRSTTKRN